MGLVTRKPVFYVCGKISLYPATRKNTAIFHFAKILNIVSYDTIIKALIRSAQTGLRLCSNPTKTGFLADISIH